MFKSLTEKHSTINHMIIFNDSFSKFYQCNIWGICRGISMFLVSASARKYWGNEILRNLKKYVSENKIYFCWRTKSNVWLNKKSYFCLSHDFQTWFFKADHLLYYLQMPVFSFHTFFVLLYQPLRDGIQKQC